MEDRNGCETVESVQISTFESIQVGEAFASCEVVDGVVWHKVSETVGKALTVGVNGIKVGTEWKFQLDERCMVVNGWKGTLGEQREEDDQ